MDSLKGMKHVVRVTRTQLELAKMPMTEILPGSPSVAIETITMVNSNA